MPDNTPLTSGHLEDLLVTIDPSLPVLVHVPGYRPVPVTKALISEDHVVLTTYPMRTDQDDHPSDNDSSTG